jgi:hypothetical protein
MRKLAVAALFLVAGCDPASTRQERRAVPAKAPAPVTEPLVLPTDGDLSADINLPHISGSSPAASQMISRELGAVEQQAIWHANLCRHIAGKDQSSFEFEPESINTRQHFLSVRFTAKRTCGEARDEWAVVRTFDLRTGKQADPFDLMSMTVGHWQALVEEQMTTGFRACTDRGGSDVIAMPMPYIAKGGIGVDLPIAQGAPRSCLGERLVIPDEAVRRASEDRLANGWRGPAHPDYIYS